MGKPSPTRRLQGIADTTLRGLPYVSLLGCIGAAANMLLSFEEPHRGMLLLSGVLTISAPLGLVSHLALTHDMTRDDKRRWARALFGASGARFFSAYFSARERDHATQLLRHGSIQSER